ncbi:MAG: hypothetical protein EBV35_03260 [Betaproteobacteria bacterium]|nr:hypothetical protein [Betaproteobacteria bacterium]
MEEINSLMHGFSVALTLPNIGFMLIGIFLGVLIGVLPGLGGANGVAILLPLTFTMPPTSAIIMLSCIYWGALFGGAITSILFNIPGEPWSVATTFDGYPMAQKGRAGQALTAAFTSSFVGALFAVLLITFLSPLVAKFALQFGPAEFFGVYLLTFCAFIGMSKEPPVKTLASMMLGFALAAVGLDTVTGTLRMTFGSTELLNGFDFLTAVIGLFGIGEILLTMEEGLAFKGKSAAIKFSVVLETWKELLHHGKTFVRSTIIGCWMGITPGGATPASFMVFKKLEYPLAPLVLALVLGKSAESSFRQAMLLSDGSVSIFWSNALVTTLVVLALGLLFSPAVAWLRHRGKEAH